MYCCNFTNLMVFPYKFLIYQVKYVIKMYSQTYSIKIQAFSIIANYCRENNHNFNSLSAKIICSPNSIFELDFLLEVFHIHVNYNNIVDCGFAIPPVIVGKLALILISPDSSLQFQILQVFFCFPIGQSV